MEWDRTGYDGTGYKISEPIIGDKEENWSLELLFNFGGQVCMHVHKCICVVSYNVKWIFHNQKFEDYCNRNETLHLTPSIASFHL